MSESTGSNNSIRSKASTEPTHSKAWIWWVTGIVIAVVIFLFIFWNPFGGPSETENALSRIKDRINDLENNGLENRIKELETKVGDGISSLSLTAATEQNATRISQVAKEVSAVKTEAQSAWDRADDAFKKAESAMNSSRSATAKAIEASRNAEAAGIASEHASSDVSAFESRLTESEDALSAKIKTADQALLIANNALIKSKEAQAKAEYSQNDAREALKATNEAKAFRDAFMSDLKNGKLDSKFWSGTVYTKTGSQLATAPEMQSPPKKEREKTAENNLQNTTDRPDPRTNPEN